MTSLTLRYLELLETIRNNNLVAQLKDRELMELIRNNRRVFKINLDKNTIQKAYNDQLDKREREKLEHQINIDFKKLAETIRHNKASEVNERYAATVGAFSRGKVGAATIGMAAGIANQGLSGYTVEPQSPPKVENNNNSAKFDSEKSKSIDWRDYASLSPNQALKAGINLRQSSNTRKINLKGGPDYVKTGANQSSKEVSWNGTNQSNPSRTGSERGNVSESKFRSTSSVIISPGAKSSTTGRTFGPGIS